MAGKIIVPTTAIISATLVMTAAQAETRDYDVESFTAVKVAQGINADVKMGDAQSIRADGPDGKMDKLSISVKDGTLIIRRQKDKRRWGWGGANPPRFTVYVTAIDLNSVDVSSGADVNVTGVKAENFSIDSSSGADVSVSGTCANVIADASSGSDINADKLVCKSAVADVSSGADISIHATDTFSGDASSGGNIDVYGRPTTVNTDESSGGDIDLRG